MANFADCNDDFSISIPNYETCNNVTYYNISVRVKDVTWHIGRRYKDFTQLHNSLVADHGISKDLLPPKKIIGNRDREFIEKRRISLEIYVQTILNFLQKAVPTALRKFLEFDKYDILFIVQDLASFCFSEGDKHLQKSKNYTFNPLQLHSISKRLEQACPVTESCDSRYNLSHVLDFCGSLNSVTIRGGNHNIGTSNLVYNKLPFELTPFKNISGLLFYNVRLDYIYNLGQVRQNVNSIVVCNSAVKIIGDVLLCDKVHKHCDDDDDIDESLLWVKLNKVDFSWNEIKSIDKSIRLAPNLRHLTMDGNQIESLDGVELAFNLTHLCLSANKIILNECLSEKLKKIVDINLSKNKIMTLSPFSKLLTLRRLDVSNNRISDEKEVKHIVGLPHLNYLVLTGNPVSSIIDYRVKIFEYFSDKANDLCLDHKRPSQKELDTAAVFKSINASTRRTDPVSRMRPGF